MKRYWWTDAEGQEHGPLAISELLALYYGKEFTGSRTRAWRADREPAASRSESVIDGTTLIREEGRDPVPFSELRFHDELQRAQNRRIAIVFGYIGVAVIALVAFFVSVLAPAPISLVALGICIVLALVLFTLVIASRRKAGRKMSE